LSHQALTMCQDSTVRALGVDYGLKRIGLAISDASGTLARPLDTIDRARLAHDRAAVAALLDRLARLEDEPITVIVVGWPRRLDGSPNDQTPRVEAFAAELRRQTLVPVVLQDERLSSREAESRLATREKDWRRRKAQLDAAAAAVILQDYLDTRPSSTLAPEHP
jgi:putative Holliday junction resolvase